MSEGKVYGVADKAWQAVVGCDPKMPCARRCWARRTVARIVKCQEPVSPERAEFFQIALTPDGKQWSGEVRLDEAHLLDPMKWRKPARIATGFHGDWGRLPIEAQGRMMAVMGLAEHHSFMPLTKQPEDVYRFLCGHPKTTSEDFASVMANRSIRFTTNWPFRHVSIGCSVMYQSEADKMREPMAAISALGWRTHVWYEPAIGPVDWNGWEFLEQLIMGGESGSGARPSDLRWYRDSIRWARKHSVAPWMKQLGSDPRESNANGSCRDFNCTHPDCGWIKHPMKDRKGEALQSMPADLRVREYPALEEGHA